eukprot:143063-Chlamydomonas_euryale.AAC.1
MGPCVVVPTYFMRATAGLLPTRHAPCACSPAQQAARRATCGASRSQPAAERAHAAPRHGLRQAVHAALPGLDMPVQGGDGAANAAAQMLAASSAKGGRDKCGRRVWTQEECRRTATVDCRHAFPASLSRIDTRPCPWHGPCGMAAEATVSSPPPPPGMDSAAGHGREGKGGGAHLSAAAVWGTAGLARSRRWNPRCRRPVVWGRCVKGRCG